MIDQEADAILSAHTNRPLSLCKFCRGGEHRRGKYGCLSWTDCECQTCMEELDMSATPPAVRATDLEKRLEGLTPDDLQTAMEMARMLPLLERYASGAEAVSRMQEETATDAMNEAGRIRKLLWDKHDVKVKKAFELHRLLTADRANAVSMFDKVIDVCKRLIGRRRLEEQRRLDAERREKERLAREDAERQRQAEVDARLAEAAEFEKRGQTEAAEFILQEARDAEEAPAIPVFVPEVVSQRVQGASVALMDVGKVRIDNSEDSIVKLFCFYLGVEYQPEMEARAMPLIREVIGVTKYKKTEILVYALSQSGLNDQLGRGLKLPGVSVTKEPIVRNLGRK